MCYGAVGWAGISRLIIGASWPIPGEPDLMPFLTTQGQRGGVIVVIEDADQLGTQRQAHAEVAQPSAELLGTGRLALAGLGVFEQFF